MKKKKEQLPEFALDMANMYMAGYLNGAMLFNRDKTPKEVWRSVRRKALKSWKMMIKGNYNNEHKEVKTNDNI